MHKQVNVVTVTHPIKLDVIRDHMKKYLDGFLHMKIQVYYNTINSYYVQ